MDTVLQRERPGASEDDYEQGFTMGAGETLADVLAFADAVAAETDAVVRAIPDLGQAVPVPQGVPWFPDDLDAWSVRWVLVHLVERDRPARGPRRHRARGASTARPPSH